MVDDIYCVHNTMLSLEVDILRSGEREIQGR